jgi:hypothetical protein
MPRYRIEVPHPTEIVACARVVEVFLRSGSHFLTHADWGCKDGVHKAWLSVEAPTREEARRVVPTAFRDDAEVVQLNQFSLDEAEYILHHGRPASTA